MAVVPNQDLADEYMHEFENTLHYRNTHRLNDHGDTVYELEDKTT